MKKLSYKVSLLALTASVFGVTTNANAQADQLGTLMKAGIADANILLQEYMKPLGAGFATAANTGWTNTARTHKFLGFDLRVGAVAVPIPEQERYFSLPTNLTTLELRAGSPAKTPTFVGDEGASTFMFDIVAKNFDPDGAGPIPPQSRVNVGTLEMPKGVWADDIGTDPAIVAPSVQASVGLILKTDVMIRYVPTYDFGEYGKVGLMGVGIKHNLKQWIPIVKRLPFIDLAAVGGYSKFDYSVPLDLKNAQTNAAIPGQEMKWNTTAWNANVIAGITLKIPIISLFVEPSIYAGIGIEDASSTLDMKGQYVYKTGEFNGTSYYDTVNDPISLDFKSPNSNRMMAGARLKVLSLFYVNAEYTKATYSSYNVGFGFTLR